MPRGDLFTMNTPSRVKANPHCVDVLALLQLASLEVHHLNKDTSSVSIGVDVTDHH
jgi:hypothetical protein